MTRYEYRLTKYDPALRDEEGAFTGDDWTAVSQIGETFGGKQLTLADYLDVEARHLIVLASFLEEAGVERLTACEVEDAWATSRVKDGDELSPLETIEVVRAMLREQIWCRLRLPDTFYIHVGWDYYVYVGSNVLCERSVMLAEELGLFLDADFPSPYAEIATDVLTQTRLARWLSRGVRSFAQRSRR